MAPNCGVFDIMIALELIVRVMTFGQIVLERPRRVGLPNRLDAIVACSGSHLLLSKGPGPERLDYNYIAVAEDLRSR